ncbi:MAG: acyl-CoA thioesterase [Xanthomonadales bacterium]|nr:acyl-CoA thioesterase [Gammaproteobacteria bacterium]MBT8053129.1 acyl-CoA thioesterase [Gammaproteobacteria bacterium]NND56219.1 acyl-CoA thioesterase [Xanthomonadales bacterium]NNK52294.1 acyl-CoA thioesterase [Xanthomonadales bacterium]
MSTFYDFPHIVAAEDIDQLGHAGNFHYIKWMQHAAIAHSTANGWPTERYETLGAGWVVRSHQITYLKPAFEGDEVLIRTWVASARPALSVRKYEIKHADGTLLATAETEWVFVNYKTQRPVRIPPEVASCFKLLEE